ncbi:MAG: glutamate synthase, partial [Planctomycetes bacterium]|nr:glutamate synthase [Planctomycetota bacterium]
VSDKKTFATGLPGVFAAGSAVKQIKLAVRAMADGRAAAISIGRHLSGEHPTGEARPFSVHIGKLTDGEMKEFASGASSSGRVEPSAGARAGFTPEEAREEGLRCLRCDCRKRDNCKLRDHAAACDARANRYKTRRRTFELEYRHPEAVYEPGKCINCGICVRIATEAGEPLGLTFVGRGFDVRVAVPFNSSLAEGLRKVAHECVCACPTGALAFKDSVKVGTEVFSKGNEE